jgi:hypothetical protein
MKFGFVISVAHKYSILGMQLVGLLVLFSIVEMVLLMLYLFMRDLPYHIQLLDLI